MLNTCPISYHLAGSLRGFSPKTRSPTRFDKYCIFKAARVPIVYDPRPLTNNVFVINRNKQRGGHKTFWVGIKTRGLGRLPNQRQKLSVGKIRRKLSGEKCAVHFSMRFERGVDGNAIYVCWTVNWMVINSLKSLYGCLSFIGIVNRLQSGNVIWWTIKWIIIFV